MQEATEMTHYRIGQTFKHNGGQIVAAPLGTVAWYILLTAPQQEFAVSAWLTRSGAVECWLPTEEAWRRVRGPRRKVSYLRRLAPGYVFLAVDRAPLWHVIRDASLGRIRGVVCQDGEPLEVPEAALARMRRVPARIAQIRERARQERIIRPGDRAVIATGPLAGWAVDVARLDRGIAHFVLPLLGGREASAPVEGLVKQAVA